MKKNILLIGYLFLWLFVFSSLVEAKPHGKIEFSTAVGINSPLGRVFYQDLRSAVGSSLAVNINYLSEFSSWFSLVGGTDFSWRSINIQFGDNSANNIAIKNVFWDFNLLARFRLPWIYCEFGGFYGWRLPVSKINITEFDQEELKFTEDNFIYAVQFKNDFGFDFGCGLEIPLAPKLFLMLGIHGKISLRECFYSLRIGGFKNNSHSLTCGMAYLLY